VPAHSSRHRDLVDPVGSTAMPEENARMTAALDATGLVKRYASAVALAGVDLRVAAGAVHGLLGPNGAGKTTLLRIIFGLVRADAGRLTLFDRPVSPGRTDRDLGGFVDAPQFYPHLSGRRNLEMLAAYDRDGAPDRIDALLKQVGLAQRADRRVGGYSLGMRQRLGIASALLRQPRLLVLDEPSNGLDPAGIRDLHELIGTLAADGLTILLSSHRMDEVEVLCDEVTILHRGEVAHAGTVAGLRAQAPAPEHRLHTDNDGEAVEVAGRYEGIGIEPHPSGGLAVRARQPDLDRYVVGLGKADIAVRTLGRSVTPLELMFFELTETGPDDGAPGAVTVAEPQQPQRENANR
jgi:ABC-2 type transport system ATP-binding protein